MDMPVLICKFAIPLTGKLKELTPDFNPLLVSRS